MSVGPAGGVRPEPPPQYDTEKEGAKGGGRTDGGIDRPAGTGLNEVNDYADRVAERAALPPEMDKAMEHLKKIACE